MPSSTAFRPLADAISRLPLERLHELAHDLVPLLRTAYRPRVVRGNLAAAFPGQDARALADDFYAAFAEVCLEVLRALSMDADELSERVSIEGAEVLEYGSTLLLMSHHGNMIWAVNALACKLRAPVSVVYKMPHVTLVRDILVGVAERFGVAAVPVKDVRRRLIASRQRGGVWTLVADQRPGRHRHTVDLCGRRTAFHAGPERIARALKWPVRYLSCERVAPGRYRCRVEDIAAPPYGDSGFPVVERYAACVQRDIDCAPTDWLWSHDRWRGAAEGA